MGLLPFLSRHAARPAMSAEEAEALRTRLVTMSAVLDDVSAELVRMRRREEARSARFEQLTGRIDFLARQVRALDDVRKGRGNVPDRSMHTEAEEFFAFIDAAAGGAVRGVPARGVPDRVASELEAFFFAGSRPRE